MDVDYSELKFSGWSWNTTIQRIILARKNGNSVRMVSYKKNIDSKILTKFCIYLFSGSTTSVYSQKLLIQNTG